MTTIRLLDARRGLHSKCEELFTDAKIAEAIYRYLCDGIEECEDAEPEWKSGTWIYDGEKRICPFCKDFIVTGRSIVKYCWNCGARLNERSKDAKES